MSNIAQQISEETVVFSGDIIEVSHRQMQVGDKIKIFEKGRRPPGTRLIILDKTKDKILLTQEYRYEVKKTDYRLPGGKVCNTLKEYLNILKNGNLQKAAEENAFLEANEETGINPLKVNLFYIAKSGGPTIDWDLYYYVVDEFTTSVQDLKFGEDITHQWYSYQEAIDIALSGAMNEDRSVGVLMKYFRKIGKI